MSCLETLKSKHVDTSSQFIDENDNPIAVLCGHTIESVSSEVPPDILMVEDTAQPHPTSSTAANNPQDARQTNQQAANLVHVGSVTCEWAGPSDAKYDLEKLFLSSVKGRILISLYRSKKKLTDKDRNLLGDLIVSDFVKNDLYRKLSYDDEKCLASHITKLFPTEKEEIWRNPTRSARQKSLGRGKIIMRYYHLRRTMLAANLIQKRASDAGLDDDEDDLFENNSGFTEEMRVENEDNDLWLRNNKAPWSKVSILWEQTSKWRMTNLLESDEPIQKYLKQYPLLQEPQGYMLLESDFQGMYPKSSMSFYLQEPRLRAFIVDNVRSLSKKQIDGIESSLTDEGKYIRILRSLPFLFPVVTAVKLKKKQWRPSRSECADGLILHVTNPNDLQTDIDVRRNKYAEFGLPMAPLAVMVGQDEDHIQASYVSVDRILYEVDNPRAAFDLAFKIAHALDSEYNKDVLREYLFLQAGVYDIPSKKGHKIKDPKINDAIDRFKKLKETGSVSF